MMQRGGLSEQSCQKNRRGVVNTHNHDSWGWKLKHNNDHRHHWLSEDEWKGLIIKMILIITIILITLKIIIMIIIISMVQARE